MLDAFTASNVGHVLANTLSSVVQKHDHECPD